VSPLARLPSTARTSDTPDVPPGAAGVTLAAPSVLAPTDRLIVSGQYQLSEQEAALIDDRLHRALVAVVTIGHSFCVWNPFREAVLFADDDERFHGSRRGCFHFDAFPDRSELPPGEYTLFVSLGTYLSNATRVLVR
jgi:hypothetical protein